MTKAVCPLASSEPDCPSDNWPFQLDLEAAMGIAFLVIETQGTVTRAHGKPGVRRVINRANKLPIEISTTSADVTIGGQAKAIC